MASTRSALKVLYVTHDPGLYHEHPEQQVIFEQIADQQSWELTILSDTPENLPKTIVRNPQFGSNADVLVYNFCIDDCENLEAAHHLIEQARTLNKPILVLHGSFHSFWPTFKEPQASGSPTGKCSPQTYAKVELHQQWSDDSPDSSFPSWPSLTGIGSTYHSPACSIHCDFLEPNHSTLTGISSYTSTPDEELYFNCFLPLDATSITPILKGTSPHGEALVLWEHQLNTTKVLCFSLGHSIDEWNKPEFKQILINSVNYLSQ